MIKEANDYTLGQLRIVMVSTTEAGNIGAAARAMKNMCLSQLYLVSPKNFPSAVATARASGADDILQNAVVCTTLQEAIADCHLAIGTSVRERSIKWQQVNVIEACKMIENTLKTSQHFEDFPQDMPKIAVVFGTENSGLSNEELELCQVRMTIPGNPAYLSLNVAQAVQIFAYQLYIYHQQNLGKSSKSQKILKNPSPATVAELEHFYKHLEQALITLNYMDSNRPNELLIRRLRKLFSRTQLQKDELAILRGILNKISPYR